MATPKDVPEDRPAPKDPVNRFMPKHRILILEDGDSEYSREEYEVATLVIVGGQVHKDRYNLLGRDGKGCDASIVVEYDE